LLFFAKWEPLRFLQHYSPEAPHVDFKNIDGFIGAIIASGQATLHELKTVYTLEDAFKMWEVIAITRYNEHLAVTHAQKQQQLGR
jgi:hypothetical protein